MFGYHAAGNRCAVDLGALRLPIGQADAMRLLRQAGFEECRVDLVALARDRVGASRYRRGAAMTEAPDLFDCSGFIKWLFAQRGIWLPRRSIQQFRIGRPVAFDALLPGDLVFSAGSRGYFDEDPASAIGHVGLLTGEGTVIHAADRRRGVAERSFRIPPSSSFRGARRVIPAGSNVRTLVIPPDREVETSDDIRWIILQRLTRP